MASGDFFYESSHFLSASSSPHRFSMESHLSFYSVPPTPNRKPSLGSEQDFEFESPKLEKKEKQGLHRCTESMPAMSFADELFFDGKVKLKLKPPPGSRSPTAVAGVSSPRSPLSWRNNNLWNDDFDPFMAALESVKEDRNTRTHSRARSMLPFDGTHHQSSVFYEQKQGKEEVEPKSPVQEKLAEPRGLDFTRRLRQVKTLGEEEDGDINGRETKRQKIMRFLAMKSRFLGKEEEKRNGDRDCSHDSSRRMNDFLRRLRFNGSREMDKGKKKKAVVMASTASATGNGSRAVAKVQVLQYMPRLLLCMGYGLRRSSYNVK